MRQHYNLTKRALAEKCSVSEDYVAAVEACSKFPSLKFCLLCGDLFGANPNWVKNKWANEKVCRFPRRLRMRLDLYDNGGS